MTLVKVKQEEPVSSVGTYNNDSNFSRGTSEASVTSSKYANAPNRFKVEIIQWTHLIRNQLHQVVFLIL